MKRAGPLQTPGTRGGLAPALKQLASGRPRPPVALRTASQFPQNTHTARSWRVDHSAHPVDLTVACPGQPVAHDIAGGGIDLCAAVPGREVVPVRETGSLPTPPDRRVGHPDPARQSAVPRGCAPAGAGGDRRSPHGSGRPGAAGAWYARARPGPHSARCPGGGRCARSRSRPAGRRPRGAARSGRSWTSRVHRRAWSTNSWPGPQRRGSGIQRTSRGMRAKHKACPRARPAAPGDRAQRDAATREGPT